MSNYYNMRDAKVRISDELRRFGWNIYGYKEDRSDSMTDYFDPADWEGIAEKNGFILCIDIKSYNVKHLSGQAITKYNPSATLSITDREKINKLLNITQERGATAGEEENAKKLVEKIKEKTGNTDLYEVIGHFPTFQENPGKCNWHIEKDGNIYAKGMGIGQFYSIPDYFDIAKMEYQERYKKVMEWRNGENIKVDREITEDLEKTAGKLKDLIIKWERIATMGNTCGDGTKETAQQAEEQTKPLEKVIKKKIKKVTKPVKVDRNYFKVGDLLSFSYHGGFWEITAEGMRKGTWTQKDGSKITEERKTFSYECLGKKYNKVKNTKRFYQWERSIMRELEEGKISIYELKEVEEVEEVITYKEVKPKTKKTSKKTESKQENKQDKPITETKTEPTQKQQQMEININKEFNGIEVSFSDIPSKEIRETLKANGFRWHKFKKIWYAKNTGDRLAIVQAIPLDNVQNNNIEQTPPAKETVQEIAENIIDKSTQIIIDLNLEPMQYLQNKTYKLKLIEYLDKNNYKITAELLEYIEYEELKNLLEELQNNQRTLNQVNLYAQPEPQKGFLYDAHFKEWDLTIEQIIEQIKALNISYVLMDNKIGFKGITAEQVDQIKEINNKNGSIFFIDNITSEQEQQQKEEQEQKQRTTLLEKINKNIDSLQNKIDKLSGEHKVNTYKRMQEQANRDSKINGYEIDIKILEYVQEKLINNELITALEENLILSSFRNEIHGHYISKYGRYPREPIYPQINYQYDKDNWYNKEAPKRQKRLNKANIYNNNDLLKAVEEYKIIYDTVDRYVSPTEQKIKRLTNEYKMLQKGDVHFTDNKKLLEIIIDLADITADHKVLEPSAGIGSIADKVKEITSNIDVCEYNYSFVELLKLKGYNVVENDFLQYSSVEKYDRIIANVPFSDEQEHIKHIYNNLKDGGRAVIITSPHYTFACDKKSIDFRNWLDAMTHEIIDAPEKSFTHTQVSCKILVIDKDEQISQVAI